MYPLCSHHVSPQTHSGSRTDTELKTIMEWMTGFKIFPQDIPQSMLKTLCKGMENKNMVKDEVLFLQGDPSGQFYIIIEGQLQLAIQDSPEEEVKLRLKRDADPVAFAQTDWNANKDSGMGKFLKILKSGIAFGELSMMDDTQRTTAVFCASATAQLCVIDRDLYNKTLRNFHKSKAGTQQLYGQISALATFKSWIPEIRQQLVDAAVVKRYGRGSYVIENGAKIDSMLIVLEGEVAAMSEKKKKSDYKDGVHTAVHMHGNKGENQVSHTHTRPSCGFTFLVQHVTNRVSGPGGAVHLRPRFLAGRHRVVQRYEELLHVRVRQVRRLRRVRSPARHVPSAGQDQQARLQGNEG